MGVTTNPIPVKAALNMLGHRVGGLRLPLVEADEDEQAAVRVGARAPRAAADRRSLGRGERHACGSCRSAGWARSART